MYRRVLIDTGPLVALLDASESFHEVCTDQLKSIVAPALTTWPVLTEAAWLLRSQPQNIQQLLVWVYSGKINVSSFGNEASPWLATFFRKYQDLEPQLADASLVYVAEREDLDTVFTLDKQDFSIYRFRRNRKFRLLPQ